MARLNERPSHAPSSRYASATPQPQLGDSDQENRDPGARHRSKGKGAAMAPPPGRSSLPTPTSDPGDTSRGQKRKRVEIRGARPAADEEEEDSAKFNKYYDPNQDAETRRENKRKSRAMEREFNERRDVLLNHDNGEGLLDTISSLNAQFKHTKQTGDATLDSRMLVNLSDLAFKKTALLMNGNNSTGVDVDEFLAKCITYMRNGGPSSSQRDNGAPSSTQRRRTRDRHADDVDDDDAGQELDWELLGRNACFPYNNRPPVPTFLLGPLSVEKKQRTHTQRRAKNTKDANLRESRPETLAKDDLQQSEDNGLTAVCQRVNAQLRRHIKHGTKVIQEAGFTEEDEGTERYNTMLRKCRLSSDGGVSLFEYVVNPRSFGQTVENLFYISFLIKEGAVGVQLDRDGLPTLMTTKATTLEQQREARTKKHQAVFAIDYATWEQLIEAFDIREPMIPHREEEQHTQMGARGWYT